MIYQIEIEYFSSTYVSFHHYDALNPSFPSSKINHLPTCTTHPLPLPLHDMDFSSPRMHKLVQLFQLNRLDQFVKPLFTFGVECIDDLAFVDQELINQLEGKPIQLPRLRFLCEKQRSELNFPATDKSSQKAPTKCDDQIQSPPPINQRSRADGSTQRSPTKPNDQSNMTSNYVFDCNKNDPDVSEDEVMPIDAFGNEIFNNRDIGDGASHSQCKVRSTDTSNNLSNRYSDDVIVTSNHNLKDCTGLGASFVQSIECSGSGHGLSLIHI